ncbi:MAG: putative Ig domain-containing protein [Prevotellaceae bacterium]|jgi:gliding motility-associated-like protein|nr:putative Ig domain-containing protein [Prevotellaceae bacterium]
MKRLAVVLFLLICGITGHAQCSFELEAVVIQDSECASSGIIQVNMSGDDVDLTNVLISLSDGALINMTSNVNNQQFTTLPGGEYTVTASTFCKNSGQTVTQTATATIVSKSKEMNAYISDSRKSLNCGNTGMATILILEGKAPYSIEIVSAPAGYSGDTDFQKDAQGAIVFDDLPPGHYDFKVTDACSYTIPAPINIQTVTSDFPSDPYYYYYYPGMPPAGCNEVSLNLNYVAGEMNYYWNQNREKYYEAAFSVNGIDLGWMPVETMKITLPYTIRQMRENGYNIDVKLRMKECPTVEQTVDIIYLVPNSIHISWAQIDCEAFKFTFWVNYICYPYDWEISETLSGDVVASATGVPDGGYQDVVLELKTNYTLKITDSDGSEMTQTFYQDQDQSYWFNSHTNFCLPDTFLGFYYLTLYNSIIPAGTRIRQISGPATPHPDVTLDRDVSYYSIFSENYEDLPNVWIEEGIYTFEITNICGDPTIYKTFEHKNYELRGEPYTSEEACDGLRIFPSRRFYLDNVNQGAYYQMIEAPAEVDISSYQFHSSETDPVGKTGKYFLLPMSGHYVFKVYHLSYDPCAADTIKIDYERKVFNLDNRSVYICQQGGTPQFYLRAQNGIAPYTYDLLENGSIAQSNHTGDFIYGNPANSYSVKVTDNCGKNFTVPLQVLDLAYDLVVTGTDKLCLGDTIFLNCMSLGSSNFSWTGPDGFSATDQNTYIPHASADNSGEYTIRLQPFGCPEPINQKFNVNVYIPAKPDAPDTVRFCVNGDNTLPAINPLPNHSLVWYSDDGVTECSPPEVNTATAHKDIYYLSQKDNDLGCESDKHKIVLIVEPLPSSDITAGPLKVCPGSAPVIEILNSDQGYIYDVYANPDGTNKLLSVTGDGNDIQAVLPGTIDADSTYYIRIINNGCATPGLTQVTVQTKKLFISPDVLPPYFFDQPYSFQLSSNAEGGVYSLAGLLPPGMSLSASGLFSGTVAGPGSHQENQVTATVTDADGCAVSKDYLLRTCENAPETPETEVYYCEGEEASPLQASSPTGLPLQWYKGAERLDEAPVPNTDIVGEQVFYVAQINEDLDCEGDKAEITVVVKPAPAADFVASTQDICFGDSPSILLEGMDGNNIYDIYSDNELTDKIVSITGKTDSLVNMTDVLEDNKTYYISVVDYIGCVSLSYVAIEATVRKLDIHPESLPPYARDVEYEQYLSSNAELPNFAITAGRLPDGLAMNPDGRIYGVVHNIEHVAAEFTVRVRDKDGCTAVREYTFESDLFIPKAFTPDGDGINDVFMRGYKLVIFDRLGIIIFEGADGWDGTYKGKIAPPDIYFYKLFYPDKNGITRIITGYVGTIVAN